MKTIDVRYNSSLGELNWRNGELVAFDSTSLGESVPLILAMPSEIVRGFGGQVQLIFSPLSSKVNEAWAVHSKKPILGLWSSHIELIGDKFIQDPYFAEVAYAGREAIYRALKENMFGLNIYADMLTSGKLTKIFDSSQLRLKIRGQLDKIKI